MIAVFISLILGEQALRFWALYPEYIKFTLENMGANVTAYYTDTVNKHSVELEERETHRSKQQEQRTWRTTYTKKPNGFLTKVKKQWNVGK
jgi:hypothetical protein